MTDSTQLFTKESLLTKKLLKFDPVNSYTLNSIKVYGTAFGSWGDLQAAKDWRPKTDMENAKEIADNLAFVKLALHRYYSVAKAAIRKYDKNT